MLFLKRESLTLRKSNGYLDLVEVKKELFFFNLVASAPADFDQLKL
jgi:hypothetical protein